LSQANKIRSPPACSPFSPLSPKESGAAKPHPSHSLRLNPIGGSKGQMQVFFADFEERHCFPGYDDQE